MRLIQLITFTTAILLTSFWQTKASAGIFEFELGMNYRSSTIDKDNYQTTTSYLGSVAYYFGSQSALELSYTNGQSLLSVKPSETEPKLKYVTFFKFVGLDFVLSFASKESSFQPYIKVGGGHIEKTILRKTEGQGTDEIGSSSGYAPSAGLGFKIILTQGLSLKAGVDAWTSPIEENDQSGKTPTIDYSGRLGVVFAL
jgi:hypothetical protein